MTQELAQTDQALSRTEYLKQKGKGLLSTVFSYKAAKFTGTMALSGLAAFGIKSVVVGTLAVGTWPGLAIGALAVGVAFTGFSILKDYKKAQAALSPDTTRLQFAKGNWKKYATKFAVTTISGFVLAGAIECLSQNGFFEAISDKLFGTETEPAKPEETPTEDTNTSNDTNTDDTTADTPQTTGSDNTTTVVNETPSETQTPETTVEAQPETDGPSEEFEKAFEDFSIEEAPESSQDNIAADTDAPSSDSQHETQHTSSIETIDPNDGLAPESEQAGQSVSDEIPVVIDSEPLVIEIESEALDEIISDIEPIEISTEESATAGTSNSGAYAHSSVTIDQTANTSTSAGANAASSASATTETVAPEITLEEPAATAPQQNIAWQDENGTWQLSAPDPDLDPGEAIIFEKSVSFTGLEGETVTQKINTIMISNLSTETVPVQEAFEKATSSADRGFAIIEGSQTQTSVNASASASGNGHVSVSKNVSVSINR